MSLIMALQCKWETQKQPSRGVPGKKIFWKYAVNLQENTHAEVWFQYSCFATLLKSHFGMGILLKICCIFSEHFFLRRPLSGCFWIQCQMLNNDFYVPSFEAFRIVVNHLVFTRKTRLSYVRNMFFSSLHSVQDCDMLSSSWSSNQCTLALNWILSISPKDTQENYKKFQKGIMFHVSFLVILRVLIFLQFKNCLNPF